MTSPPPRADDFNSIDYVVDHATVAFLRNQRALKRVGLTQFTSDMITFTKEIEHYLEDRHVLVMNSLSLSPDSASIAPPPPPYPNPGRAGASVDLSGSSVTGRVNSRFAGTSARAGAQPTTAPARRNGTGDAQQQQQQRGVTPVTTSTTVTTPTTDGERAEVLTPLFPQPLSPNRSTVAPAAPLVWTVTSPNAVQPQQRAPVMAMAGIAGAAAATAAPAVTRSSPPTPRTNNNVSGSGLCSPIAIGTSNNSSVARAAPATATVSPAVAAGAWTASPNTSNWSTEHFGPMMKSINDYAGLSQANPIASVTNFVASAAYAPPQLALNGSTTGLSSVVGHPVSKQQQQQQHHDVIYAPPATFAADDTMHSSSQLGDANLLMDTTDPAGARLPTVLAVVQQHQELATTGGSGLGGPGRAPGSSTIGVGVGTAPRTRDGRWVHGTAPTTATTTTTSRAESPARVVLSSPIAGTLPTPSVVHPRVGLAPAAADAAELTPSPVLRRLRSIIHAAAPAVPNLRPPSGHQEATGMNVVAMVGGGLRQYSLSSSVSSHARESPPPPPPQTQTPHGSLPSGIATEGPARYLRTNSLPDATSTPREVIFHVQPQSASALLYTRRPYVPHADGAVVNTAGDGSHVSLTRNQQVRRMRHLIDFRTACRPATAELSMDEQEE